MGSLPEQDLQQLELSKKIFELSTVIEVSKEFISTLEPERTNSKIVFTMMGVVGAKRGALFSYSSDLHRLELHKAVNFPARCNLSSLELDERQGRCLEGIVKPVFLSGLPGEQYHFLDWLKGDGCVENPLLIPLVAEGHLLGLILLAEKLSASYNEDDISMLSSLANYSALALQRKRMVEMLIKSEKMADLGRLGSGIVHEIKNPLTSITMLSDMLSKSGNLDPKDVRYANAISQEAQRILRLCQNILTLARPKKPELKVLPVNTIIAETIDLVAYELKKKKVEVKLLLAESGVTPLGDAEKMKQVFLNLTINAADAMQGGGTLEISTRRSADPELETPPGFRKYSLGQFPGPEAAVITFRDGGCGIDPETLEKIFDPFFSTKGEGLGTGLGLYITKNIIVDHRGRLTVLTRQGSGTAFVIELPCSP